MILSSFFELGTNCRASRVRSFKACSRKSGSSRRHFTLSFASHSAALTFKDFIVIPPKWFANRVALIFHRLGLDPLEVLEAAGTKWNFLPFRPGLVGGQLVPLQSPLGTPRTSVARYPPQ